MHLIWQLFRTWLVFGAAVITLFVPGLMVFGAFDSWLPADASIDNFDSGQIRLLVGANSDQRSYLLIPRLFSDWSITTVVKRDGAFTAEVYRFEFFLWLAVFGPFVWYGSMRVWPRMLRSVWSVAFRNQPKARS